MEVEIERQAERDLERIPKKDAQKIVDKLFIELANKPYLGKKMNNPPRYKGHLSYNPTRNYRVIYYVKDQTIYINRIGTRQSIYKA